MDTPITVSSTSTVPNKSDFLQLNYSPGTNKQSVISLSSTSFERVPVSWTRKNAIKRTDSNTTLTNIQKVSNWIKSIEGPNRDSLLVDLDNGNKNNTFKCSKTEPAEKEGNTDSKSLILFRYDFNKSVPEKTYYQPPKNAFGQSPPLASSGNLESGTKDKVNKLNSTISFSPETSSKKRIRNSPSKTSTSNHLNVKDSEPNGNINSCSKYPQPNCIEKDRIKMTDVKSDGSSDAYEVPLSPESRKKELCSYLQLMNPADKKERFILQNRRSTRVRNLTAMQEKRKMVDDKVSESGDSEKLLKNMEKCTTWKSFNELNIRVEKGKLIDEYVNNRSVSVTEKDNFSFPFPSKEIFENVQDFDITMAKLLPKYKRICRIKNSKLNCKEGLSKNVSGMKKNVSKNLPIPRSKHQITPKQSNVQYRKKAAKISKIRSEEKVRGHKLKKLLKKKYKKTLMSPRMKSLRSTGKLKNVSLKKLIGKKEKELLNVRNIRSKSVAERETKKESPRPKVKLTAPSDMISKSGPTSPQCEIVTILRNTEDNHIDIENLMDDMIDFNNLTEEHKKCLIENRILSTKSPAQFNNTKEERSQSLYRLDAIPLFRFQKSDLNEVEKISEVYENSILTSDRAEVLEKCVNGTDLKTKENVIKEKVLEHKTDTIGNKECQVTEVNLEKEDTNDNKLRTRTDDEDHKSTNDRPKLVNGITLQEHDYAGLPSNDEEEEEKDNEEKIINKALLVSNCIEVNPRFLEKKTAFELLPYNKTVDRKSLHRSLQYVKKKTSDSLEDHSFTREWDSDTLSKQKSKKQSHYISISKQNGAVLKAFYVDFNLIVCQENIVSFWMQTPLGNVLGSQNMWIPRGQTQRLVLNGKCMQKESMEMVIAMDMHVAYIELWTNEHKSDIRQGPVADVFATIYSWKQRQNGLDKKVLQLENIKGFADDVQYSVLKSALKIIVSWHSAQEDGSVKKTFIHAYQLAADYQTVANIFNIEPVDHYVSSLHNIEECDNLIMGCGENKITLWNVEYGYIIATIELSEIKSPLSTLWVKCDRGFLFALQQCVDRELRLIAINGINHSWKKLASYIPPEGFDRLRGVCIENGLLLSFYDQGVLCWKAETGEPMEEINMESEIIPSGKYVILIEDEQILVKHAMTHLMSLSIDET